jgi:hypothetical protein
MLMKLGAIPFIEKKIQLFSPKSVKSFCYILVVFKLHLAHQINFDIKEHCT